jgi:periplasmic divalent cation tolerance protein
VTDKIVVLVTAGSLRESRKIGRKLIESRLAACVNITAQVESIYRWQGKISNGREYLLIIKTTRNLFDELKSTVARIHSYTTPEIISLPIIDGWTDYLQWIESSVGQVRGLGIRGQRLAVRGSRGQGLRRRREKQAH